MLLTLKHDFKVPKLTQVYFKAINTNAMGGKLHLYCWLIKKCCSTMFYFTIDKLRNKMQISKTIFTLKAIQYLNFVVNIN